MPIENFESLLEGVLNGDAELLSDWNNWVLLNDFDEKEIKQTLQVIEPLLSDSASPKRKHALYLRALWHYAGIGGEVNFAEAIKCYQEAANLGHSLALQSLGIIYEGGKGVKADHSLAMKFYTEAAELENIEAMKSLALMYRKRGGDKDYQEAAKLYEKAIDLNDPEAMDIRAYMYEEGLGGPEDYVQAAQLYSQAAKLGNSNSMFRRAEMYFKGIGGPQDYVKAGGLYNEAIKKGCVEAIYPRACMYRDGQGGPRDCKIAFLLFMACSKVITGINIDVDQLRSNYVFDLKRNNQALADLYAQIDKMDAYGKELEKEDNKGKMIHDHATALKQKLDLFLIQSFEKNLTQIQEEQFKSEFKEFLESKDEDMGSHRHVLKPIMLNILIALSGIGLVALIMRVAAHAISSYINNTKFSKNKAFFFAKTNTQQLVKEIKEENQWTLDL
jgi:TPR repeat protein